jgi:hypothetical protein
LVQQAVLVLAEPAKALPRVGVEGDFTAEEIASAPVVRPLWGRREMGNALSQRLLAVRPEETDQGREADEPVLMVVVHLDDEATVPHPRSVIEDLDLGIGDSALAQCAAARLRDRRPEG